MEWEVLTPEEEAIATAKNMRSVVGVALMIAGMLSFRIAMVGISWGW
jgi:hypothetical protein